MLKRTVCMDNRALRLSDMIRHKHTHTSSFHSGWLCARSTIFSRFKSDRVWTNDTVSGFQTRRLANLQKLRGDDYRPNRRKKTRLLSTLCWRKCPFIFWAQTKENMWEQEWRRPLKSSRSRARPVNPDCTKVGTLPSEPHEGTDFIPKNNPHPLGTSALDWMTRRRKQWWYWKCDD